MSQPQQQPSYPPPPAEPTFQVRTIKHTGALVFWTNQRSTATGTYVQCEAAIDSAQRHCMLLGWWSFISLLWNPISLSMNASARRTLRSQARQAHDYAAWWATNHGGGPQNTWVWTPQPQQPAWRKWWMWSPLAVIGLFAVFSIVMHATGHSHHRDINPQTPTTTTSWPTP